MTVNFIGTHQAADTTFCDNIIDYFNSLPEDKLIAGQSGDHEVKKNIKDSTDIRSIDLPQHIYNDYIRNLIDATTEYTKEYVYSAEGHRAFGISSFFNIQRYMPGQAFHALHCENQGLYRERHLAFMTYLNDVTDGGETEFYYQNIKLQPKKGRTHIWPAHWTHMHRGLVSRTQIKYITTGWIIYMDDNTPA